MLSDLVKGRHEDLPAKNGSSGVTSMLKQNLSASGAEASMARTSASQHRLDWATTQTIDLFKLYLWEYLVSMRGHGPGTGPTASPSHLRHQKW